MSNKVPDLKPHEWNHVGRGWWLHTQQATLRIRYSEHKNGLTNTIVGQYGVRAHSAQEQDENYRGFILEFRYCHEGWAYSLSVPCTDSGLGLLGADLHAVGVPLCQEVLKTVKADLRVLAHRREKHV